jgi:hypothetical protein
MADRLGLKNVKTFHGRAESLSESRQFDWVIGRSVASIPTYAFWIDHLLKDEKSKRDGQTQSMGHLVYLIGGDIEDSILNQTIRDEEISDLLCCPNVSDKRVLIFPQPAVHQLALESGEKLRVPARGVAGRSNGKSSMSSSRRRNDKSSSSRGQRTKRDNDKNSSSRGQWTKRDTSVPKQRGYESFRRYDSTE